MAKLNNRLLSTAMAFFGQTSLQQKHEIQRFREIVCSSWVMVMAFAGQMRAQAWHLMQIALLIKGRAQIRRREIRISDSGR